MIVEAKNSKFYRVKELSDEYLSPYLWEGIELHRYRKNYFVEKLTKAGQLRRTYIRKDNSRVITP